MDYALKQQLNQTIRISAGPSSLNQYGEPSFSSSSTFQARVEENSRQYERNDGEAIRTTHMVILDTGVTTPTYESYIWLPGQSASTLQTDARRVKIIRACPAEDGSLDHWEVLV